MAAAKKVDVTQLEGFTVWEAAYAVAKGWKVVLPAIGVAAIVGWLGASVIPKTYVSRTTVYLDPSELFAFQNKAADRDRVSLGGAKTDTESMAFKMSAVDSNSSAIETSGSSADEARAKLNRVVAEVQLAYPHGGGYLADIDREISAVGRSMAGLSAIEKLLRSRQDALLADGQETRLAGDPNPATSYVESLILLSDAVLDRSKRLIDLQKERRVRSAGLVSPLTETQRQGGADANLAAALCAAIAAVVSANVVLYRSVAARRGEARVEKGAPA